MADSFTAPRIGLGLFKVPPEQTTWLVEEALDVGYRHFDCASVYGNEAELGLALSASGLTRSEFTVTSKANIDELGAAPIRAALQRSLERLGLDVLDLYMVHWPAPALDLYVESFQEMLVLQQEGLIRNVAVSNFNIDYLERLRMEVGTLPVMNQVERHPYLQQRELFDYHREHGIASQAWAPLARAEILDDAELATLSAEEGCSVPQLVLAWQMKGNVSVIPKASNRARLEENFAAQNETVSDYVAQRLEQLDRNHRTGPNPSDKN